VLVALATLTPFYPLNTQDATRLAASQSIVEYGSLNVDRYHTLLLDRAYYRGHWYSDKAPGMSLLAVPPVALFHLADVVRNSNPSLPIWMRNGQLWALRVLTSGLGLLFATWLVGRAAEGLRRGYGAPVAVTFALGTIAGPLGPIVMEHDVAAALGFAAFALAASGRRWAFASGVCAGVTVLFDYSALLLAAIVGVYVLARYGIRPLAAFVAGGIPAALILAAYDQAEFGSPFHLSYRYVANKFTESQRKGFFGVGEPTGHGLYLTLFAERGLIAVSPVLLAAAVGLVWMARRGRRAEAAVCLAATIVFVLVDAGYFDPYGGASPGPRFFAIALPFLALGLVEAYRSAPRVTAALALVSIGLVTLDSLTWEGVKIHIPQTPQTIWTRVGIPSSVGIAIELAAVVAATVLGGIALVRAHRRDPPGASPAPA
jgi:hypothetical protein